MLDTVAVLAYMMTHGSTRPGGVHLEVAQTRATTHLVWKHVPPMAHALALIVSSGSHKNKTYYDVLYNLPVASTGIDLSKKTHINHLYWGVNTWGQKGHHAFKPHCPVTITLYVLDKRFSVSHALTGCELERQIKGHVISKKQRVVGSQLRVLSSGKFTAHPRKSGQF